VIDQYIIEKLIENKRNALINKRKNKKNKITSDFKNNSVKILSVEAKYDQSKNLPFIKSVLFLINSNKYTFIPLKENSYESIEFYKEALLFVLVLINRNNINLKDELDITSKKIDNINVNKTNFTNEDSILIHNLSLVMSTIKVEIFDKWAKSLNPEYLDFSFYLSDVIVKTFINKEILEAGNIQTGQDKFREFVIVKNTKSLGNIGFYKRSKWGGGDNIKKGLDKIRNDHFAGSWIPFGGLGSHPNQERTTWIVKIPGWEESASNLTQKFTKQFSELYYLGIALSFINIEVQDKYNDFISKKLNLKSTKEYVNLIWYISKKESLKPEFKLKKTFCVRVLIKAYTNMLVNMYLKENNALKSEWFSSQKSNIIGIDETSVHINMREEAMKFWIDFVGIHNIDKFNVNIKKIIADLEN
tara:strand:+ start:561 stop:1808 length:1248 start_codon:yes stop_codon:yes gene_type:complete